MSSSSTTSTATATTTAATATFTSTGTATTSSPNLKIVGVILAIISGLLIGSSFVFKKRGLLSSQAGHVAGEGVAYLKSPLWWIGMSMMILGELCNFAAYAFTEALVVTPLGALSVVICAILSSIFLKEKLTFFGWLGCALCIIGSVIIALNGPQEASVGQIVKFQAMFLSVGFLVYASLLITASLVIIFVFAPKYGKTSMLWYISVCSMIGGISVSVTTGLGAAIVTTFEGDNQFKHWFMYFLFAFIAVTLLTEVYYLNVALALFNTAMVTPTYYVMFTFFSMVTTIVLFQGLQSTASQIITIVMGFLVICTGITILQMSKVDPESLSKLDRRSTILLKAARSNTESVEEKSLMGMEDPGMDTLRGSFGAVGSIIRARSARRMSMSGGGGSVRSRAAAAAARAAEQERSWPPEGLQVAGDELAGMRRHQLYDAPVPRGSFNELPTGKSPIIAPSLLSPNEGNNRRPTIKFDSQEVVHQYQPPGKAGVATHEHRDASTREGGMPYPPIPSFTERINPTDSPRSLQEGTLISPDRDGRNTFTLPPLLLNTDGQTQSAPPTTSARFPRPNRDSRESNTPSTATLRSFPSVTDSNANSQMPWYEDEEGEEEGGSARGRPRKQRYPRSSEDDREESAGYASFSHAKDIESTGGSGGGVYP